MAGNIIPADVAIEKLKYGNKLYMEKNAYTGDVSAQKRYETSQGGQKPYAIIVSCSDSRVIPEAAFSTGIGDLFVIRVAGNVIDSHQLGSIEYAADHLGCKLVVVLGHDHCGAVDAAINHDPDGHIKYITDEIREAIGEEKDEFTACCLNVMHSVATIERDLDIQKMEHDRGLKVVGAIYHLEDGRVDFL